MIGKSYFDYPPAVHDAYHRCMMHMCGLQLIEEEEFDSIVSWLIKILRREDVEEFRKRLQEYYKYN